MVVKVGQSEAIIERVHILEIERIKQKRNTVSIENCHEDMFPDKGKNDPLNILTKRQSIALLKKFIDELDEIEKLIVAKNLNGQNFTDIGKDLNFSKQYIRKMYNKAIKKLKSSFSLLD